MVACHTQVLARRFTDDLAVLRQVYSGALPHDLGKVGAPDRILLRVAPPDAAEWVVMCRHPDDGHNIVNSPPDMAPAAITSDRPYRNGVSFEAATTEILRGAGTQFDPPAVEAMFAEEAALRRMVAMKCMQADPPGHAPTDNTTDMGPSRKHGP